MRFFSTLLPLLPLALASPLGGALDRKATTYDDDFALEVRQTFSKPPTCADGSVHIIACSGDADTHKGYGLLYTLVDDIKATINGSSHSYAVPFPKKATNDSISAMIGVQHLTSYLKYYTTGCPNTPLVLLGYSLGAIVTGNTLCGRSHIGSPYSPPLDSSYAKYIIATILYGDETRIPGQPYNLGTCTNGSGVNPRGNPAGCAAFESTFQSYCDVDDPQCCQGDDPEDHFVYPSEYDGDSLDWIVDKFDAHYGKKR